MTARARLLRIRHDLVNVAQALGSSVLTEMVAEVDAVLDPLLAGSGCSGDDGWIPVTETLPKDRAYVLFVFTYRGGGATIGNGYYHTERRSWFNDLFIGDRHEMDRGETVTHWRPLPSLPEAG